MLIMHMAEKENSSALLMYYSMCVPTITHKCYTHMVEGINKMFKKIKYFSFKYLWDFQKEM